ncbi:MAG: hypothetical protein ACRDJO_11210 [Actinomycetota bacterium]
MEHDLDRSGGSVGGTRTRVHPGELTRERPGDGPSASTSARGYSLSALQRLAGNRAVTELIQGARVGIAAPVTLQRAVHAFDGPRARSINLTSTVLRNSDFATTPGIINELEVWGRTSEEKESEEALTHPELAFRETHGLFGGSMVSVTGEPIQTVGYRMVLPQAPPWTEQAALGQVAARLGMMERDAIPADQIDDEAKQVTLEVHGLPDDGTFAALTEEHENKHVADVGVVRDEILKPWDRKLHAYLTEGRTLKKGSRPEALAALYKDLGGTPGDVGKRMWRAMRDKGRAFHKEPKGATPPLDSTAYDPVASRVRVTFRHPMA